MDKNGYRSPPEAKVRGSNPLGCAIKLIFVSIFHAIMTPGRRNHNEQREYDRYLYMDLLSVLTFHSDFYPAVESLH